MQYELLEWVATYLIHSTVLLGGVWLATTLLPKVSPATREVSWKLALLGGFLTTLVQVGAAVEGPFGSVGLPGTTASVATAPPVPESSEPTVRTEVVQHRSGDLTITTIRERKAVAGPAPAIVPAGPSEPARWPLVVLGVLVLGSIVGLTRLITSTVALRRRLADRRDVIEDPMLESFLALRQKTRLGHRVRLTASSQIRSPLAMMSMMRGWGRGEIVVPERAVDGLSAKQQEAMLAHELAHLLRRDPVWSWVTAVIEAVCFFQPLNHVARRKIQEAAELQCDDWAARNVGTGMHLAKCLAEVASWLDGGPQIPPTAVAMADRDSPIVRRITRLLDDRRRDQGANPWSAGRVGAAMLVLAGAVWLVPNVKASTPRSSSVSTSLPGAIASHDPTAGGVAFHDVRGEDGFQQSHVHIDTPQESVRVRIDRPRPVERDAEVHIRLHGGWAVGEGWAGWLGLDVEGLDEAIDAMDALDALDGLDGFDAFEDLDALLDGSDAIFEDLDASSWHPGRHAHARALEHQAREAERAAREIERAHREAARAHREAAREAARARREASIFEL